MPNLKNITFKFGSFITSVALLIGISSVNSACFIWFFQPKVPKGMERFKKLR